MAVKTCTSRCSSGSRWELCLSLYSRGMEVNWAREVLASHRLTGQRGHSSLRIPSVVSCRPQFVSQYAHRLLRKCSLSAGSLRFPPYLWFQQLVKQRWGYKSGQNNLGGNSETQRGLQSQFSCKWDINNQQTIITDAPNYSWCFSYLQIVRKDRRSSRAYKSLHKASFVLAHFNLVYQVCCACTAKKKKTYMHFV